MFFRSPSRGLIAHSARPDGIGPWLAECAYLESASIAAFDQLAAELTALGASEELVARARRSRDDEVRHANMMERLAAAHGAAPRDVQIAPFSPRSVLDMALENAVEGCVRETFGALLAHYQATVAANADVRAAMRAIAEDETRRAALAWDVAAWLEPQLAADAREEIEAARRAAWRELSSRDALAEDARHALGLPDARAHAELHTRLEHMLEQSVCNSSSTLRSWVTRTVASRPDFCA